MDTILCPHCGKKTSAETSVCLHCGKPLNVQYKEFLEKTPLWQSLLVLILIVLNVAVGISIFILSMSYQLSPHSTAVISIGFGALAVFDVICIAAWKVIARRK